MPTAQDDAILERATLHRVTLRLIPFLFVLYIGNYLDRTNVAMAALQMNRDLRFSATAYGLGAGIFFVGYSLFQVPSNLVLARVGARRWIALIMVVWGILASLMMLVHTPLHFYVLRFLLGSAEAGFFPGITYYLCRWFPSSVRARAISGFMIAIPLSGAIGNPLSGALLGLDGRLHLAGWQWLFVLEGIPSVLLGLVVLAFLTERPEDARWLTDAQRDWLVARMRDDDTASAAPHGVPPLRALAHPLIWLLGAAYFLASLVAYVYLFWAPTVVRDSLHMTPLAVGALLGGIGCLAAISMVMSGASTDRRGAHCLHFGAAMAVSAVGFAAAALLPTPAGRIGGLALAWIGMISGNPPFWCLPSMLLRGSAAAAGIALVNTLGAVGGLVGPYAVGRILDATGSTSAAFLSASVLALISAGIVLRLRAVSAFTIAQRRVAGGTPALAH